MFDRVSKAFYELFMRNRVAPYLIVLVVVELIVASYYSLMEPERLHFELLISGAVTIAVAFPCIWYVFRQHRRLELLSQELAIMSATDQMTGLLNRQTFIRKLTTALEATPLGVRAGAFAYIDADNFKSINDTYGHAIGDEVIEMIAACMRAAIRHGDLMARLGGEEFGIFMHGATVAQAASAAERLRTELHLRSVKLPVAGLDVSVSIGIASHQPGTDAHTVMRDADLSLYEAKRGGRDSIVIDFKQYRAA